MAKASNRKSGKREANGQLSRRKTEVEKRRDDALRAFDTAERQTMLVAQEARERVHGVAPENSSDQMAGSYIGRLCILGQLGGGISKQQYDAAMKWLEDSAKYSAVMHSPRQPDAVDLNQTKGRSISQENSARDLKLRWSYEDAAGAVQHAQNALRGCGNLHGALYNIVIRDTELPHLLGDCREALNALAHHYGFMTKPRKDIAA